MEKHKRWLEYLSFTLVPSLMEDSISSCCWIHAHPRDWFSLANEMWAEEMSHFQAKLEEAAGSSPFSLFLLPQAQECCSWRLRFISLGSRWSLARSCGRTHHVEMECERERNLHGWSLCCITSSISTDMCKISALWDGAVHSHNTCGQRPLMINSQYPAGVPSSAIWMNSEEGDTESGLACHTAVLSPPPQCCFPYVVPRPNICWF